MADYFVLEPSDIVPQGTLLPPETLIPLLKKHDFLIVAHEHAKDVRIRCSLHEGVKVLPKTGNINEDYSGLKLTESLKQVISYHAQKVLNNLMIVHPELKQFIHRHMTGFTMYSPSSDFVVGKTHYKIETLKDVEDIYNAADKLVVAAKKQNAGL